MMSQTNLYIEFEFEFEREIESPLSTIIKFIWPVSLSNLDEKSKDQANVCALHSKIRG